METKKDKCQYIEMCRFIGSIMILCHHSYTLMERTFFIGVCYLAKGLVGQDITQPYIFLKEWKNVRLNVMKSFSM